MSIFKRLFGEKSTIWHLDAYIMSKDFPHCTPFQRMPTGIKPLGSCVRYMK